MKKIPKSVEAALGDDVSEIEYRAGGIDRRGWRKYVLEDKTGTRNEALELVETSWCALHDADIRVFVGPTVFRTGPDEYTASWKIEFDPADGPPQLDISNSPPAYSQVFAMPNLPVPDIAEFCETGSHDGGEWEPVQKGLHKIEKISPFAIQYANAAGLGATFLNPVTAAQAKRIGDIILMQINPEAADLARYELKKLGLRMPKDYQVAMSAYLVAAGRFKLWWD